MNKIPVAAVLAGGLATRLRPLTETIPKAMLEVAGEPFITHQLRLLRREGVHHVMLCVGYLHEQIESFIGDGSRFGLTVTYRADGPCLLGTGGALRASLDVLGEAFLVLYGDSWLDAPYTPIVEAFWAARQPALMAVFRNEGLWDRSNVWFESGRIKVYDKHMQLPEMRHIDWGLGMIRSAALAGRSVGEPFDLADFYTELAKANELAGYEVKTRFYEIGSEHGLRETDALLRQQR